MSNPFDVVRQFESDLCAYTGARYAVTTTSCTMSLLLACLWFKSKIHPATITIPKRTYCSVPMSIIHAGYQVKFNDREWLGDYQLSPLPIVDSARLFTSNMYKKGEFRCVSFHISKTLGDSQGGAILHDNPEADAWFRRMRFDGRTEGVKPSDDDLREVGFHCYLSPDVAAKLVWKLSILPAHNNPLPNDNYPDLSKVRIFK